MAVNCGLNWPCGRRKKDQDPIGGMRARSGALKTTTNKLAASRGPGSYSDRESLLDVADRRIPVSTRHTQLHPTLPITTHKFHVLHGCTSQGVYESSAMFFRYDPSVMPSAPRATNPPKSALLREFLFFGDVESDYRGKGDEDVEVDNQIRARAYNEAIWAEAAEGWDAGRLVGVFVSSNQPLACIGETNIRLNVRTTLIGPHG